MSGDFAPPPGPASVPQAPRHSAQDAASADAHPPARSRSALRDRSAVAIAAWVAIAAGVALLIGISWSAALSRSDRSLEAAQVGDTGSLHPMQVVPGMCLTETGDDGSVTDASVVPCDEPHRAEVFTAVIFDIAKYPGDDEVAQEAIAQCGTKIEGLLPAEASWVAWAPSESSWARGDRTASCIAVFDSPQEEPWSPAGKEALSPPEPTVDGQDA